MPVQAVETRRLYRQIADQIEGLIASGEFSGGERLPPERDLAQKLGVSRATVREAMIALELSGRIDIRIGAGIFVREASPARRSRAPTRRNGDDPGPGAFELIDARIAIESGIAALAASNRTEPELEAMSAALRTMEHALDEGASSDDGDRAFHIAVAAVDAQCDARAHRHRAVVLAEEADVAAAPAGATRRASRPALARRPRACLRRDPPP